MKIRGFKIWYENGIIYSSNDGAFSKAPDDGVALMYVYINDCGKHRRHQHIGLDWYFSNDHELYGSNSDPIEDNRRRYPDCSFKRGKWMDYTHLEDIRFLADGDEEI